MEITKENLLKSKNGYLGVFYSKSHLIGVQNNIENVTKISDDEYHVQNQDDNGPTPFSLDGIINAYGFKSLEK